MTIARRQLLLAAFALPFVSIAATPLPQVVVDVAGVTDVPSLIAAMKRQAGNLLPKHLADKEFYAEFAKVFVEHARSAADIGYQVPEWILDKLPHRKVVIPALGLAIFALGGVTFVIPVGTIIAAVIASIAVMTIALVAAIRAAVSAASAV